MKRLLFYIPLVFLVSCKKDFDNTNQVNNIVLPGYSETGANTFGFMFSNNIWTVFGKHHNSGIGSAWLENSLDLTTIYTGVNQWAVVGSGRMSIVKNDSAITDITAGFSFIPTPPFIKSYYLTTNYPGNFVVIDLAKNKQYEVNPLRPLTLQLNKFEKIDTSLKICSGRFFGVLHNQVDANDSIIITDGRFDIKIIYK